MPDILDRAKDVEMHQRDQSLKYALAVKEPAQEIVNGRVLCIDCDTAVQMARLVAKPNAARCIYCQQAFEKMEHHYGRG